MNDDGSQLKRAKGTTDAAGINGAGEGDSVSVSSSSSSTAKDTDTGMPKKRARMVYDKDVRFSEQDGLTPEKVIYKFFKTLLDTWESDLDERPDAEKATRAGRDLVTRHKQCTDHIKPLFKLCKRGQVPKDILERLAKIVAHSERGNFRAANDEYILIAIGDR